ncbi:MAG TPA: hypothetical protein VIN77_15365 [Aurantimonas sp.]
MIEGAFRTGAIIQFFGRNQLVFFQFGNPALIGRYGCRTFGIDNAVDQLFDLPVDRDDLALHCGFQGFALGQPDIPGGTEHGFGHVEQGGRRLQAVEQHGELWRKLGDDGLRKAAYRGGC